MEVDCEKKTVTVTPRTTTLVRRSSSASTSREKLAGKNDFILMLGKVSIMSVLKSRGKGELTPGL